MGGAVINTARWLFAVGLLLLIGCESIGIGPKKAPEPEDVAVVDTFCEDNPGAAECVCQQAGEGSLACRCAQDPSRIECELCGRASASKLRTEGLIAASRGSYDSGRQLLRCSIETQPNNPRAQMLVDQLEDPWGYFERKIGSGSTGYEMQYGETLGEVAERCLGNSLYFLGLALINNVPNPSEVGEDLLLTLPGNKVCAPSSDTPSRPDEAVAGLPSETGPGLSVAPPASPSPVQTAITDPDPSLFDTSAVDRLNEEFADLLITGEEAKACSKLDEILDMDPENEAATLNKTEFCGGVNGL